MFVETSERFADFELLEGERKERIAEEQRQAELERIKNETGGTN